MIENLLQTFRWFGPSDQVSLQAISQAGATGIVTSLYHIPSGEAWSKEEINNRKNLIEEAGLTWDVVESVNIHESIKTGNMDRDRYIDNYIQTLKNLAENSINIVCYNFMPILDWTRTDLDYRLANGASALKFDVVAAAAFDLYVLERDGALNDYSIAQQQIAKQYLDKLSKEQIKQLTNNILAGLPGTNKVYTVPEFKQHLQKYQAVTEIQLRENLAYFLRAIIPYAEQSGMKMCIHPDDPPMPMLGLPRVVSTETDLKFLLDAYPSANNGITFCSGSLGARADNDLPGIVSRLGSHIHFLHLRNVQREANGSFFEADHLGGSTDMYAVMKAIIEEQQKRKQQGRNDVVIPMRPDHGHKLLDDFNHDTYHGYSAIGRLKGLAELRGLEMGIKRALFEN